MILKHKNVISNREYLRGIKENDLPILKKIYNESLPGVVKYVRRNSGTLDDAKDIFQEGILIIYKKVMAGSLELTTHERGHPRTTNRYRTTGRKTTPFSKRNQHESLRWRWDS
jgi:hypothetical protein